MFVLECPWCGCRDQSEFACHGEAHITRPPEPSLLTDAEWGEYLFFRTNPRGLHRERWVHAHGCRRWLVVARDTRDDRIYAVYKPTERPEVAVDSDDVDDAR